MGAKNNTNFTSNDFINKKNILHACFVWGTEPGPEVHRDIEESLYTKTLQYG